MASQINLPAAWLRTVDVLCFHYSMSRAGIPSLKFAPFFTQLLGFSNAILRDAGAVLHYSVNSTSPHQEVLTSGEESTGQPKGLSDDRYLARPFCFFRAGHQ